MFVEMVRYLFQAEADVFQTDFFVNDMKRQIWKALVHLVHHVGHNRAIAYAGIENLRRGRFGMNMCQFHLHPARNRPFLATGIHKKKVFLPVVIKPEFFFSDS